MIIIFVGLNGFFVASEFAAVASRRTRVSQLAAEGNRSAQQLLPVLESTKKKDKFLAATQIGITISSLILGIYGQNVIAARLLEPISNILQSLNVAAGETAANAAAATIAFTAVITILTIIQVVFGELFPKSVAIQFPERTATALILPMRISEFIMTPLIWFFNGSGTLLLRLLPGSPCHLLRLLRQFVGVVPNH